MISQGEKKRSLLLQLHKDGGVDVCLFEGWLLVDSDVFICFQSTCVYIPAMWQKYCDSCESVLIHCCVFDAINM